MGTNMILSDGPVLVASANKVNGQLDAREAVATSWLSTNNVRLALALVTALLTSRYISDGGFRFPDAPRHAMDGVLFLDMINQGGWRDPVAFTKQFYAHYPCLGFPYHYPPFFAFAETAVFAIFGPSVVAARLTVLGFHVLAVLLLFRVGATDSRRRPGCRGVSVLRGRARRAFQLAPGDAGGADHMYGVGGHLAPGTL